MIIGDALGILLKNLKIEYQGNTLIVQYGYGDQKELNKWVEYHNSNNRQKYPLIWYVKAPYSHFNDEYKVSARLIILSSTKNDWFNYTRNEKNYNSIINPLAVEVKKILTKHKYVSVEGQNFDRFKEEDYPSYGVNQDSNIRTSQTDFTSTKKNSTESITIDIVDAKALDFRMTIMAECIIKNN